MGMEIVKEGTMFEGEISYRLVPTALRGRGLASW